MRRIFERHDAYCGGLLLFLLWKACFHVGIGFRGNRAILFGTTGACFFTLVDVSVETGFAFHFFVDLPL